MIISQSAIDFFLWITVKSSWESGKSLTKRVIATWRDLLLMLVWGNEDYGGIGVRYVQPLTIIRLQVRVRLKSKGNGKGKGKVKG